MAVQKLSSKNQIVIPKDARKAMGVKGGDELLVVVKEGLTLIIPKPKRYARSLQGLAKGTYPSGYIKRERRSWLADPPPQGLPTERGRIGLDTNVFIYFLEDHPRYGAWCASLFDRIERGYNPPSRRR
jgi:AbrB family looped-hinge helix DNA binding protein